MAGPRPSAGGLAPAPGLGRLALATHPLAFPFAGKGFAAHQALAGLAPELRPFLDRLLFISLLHPNTFPEGAGRGRYVRLVCAFDFLHGHRSTRGTRLPPAGTAPYHAAVRRSVSTAKDRADLPYPKRKSGRRNATASGGNGTAHEIFVNTADTSTEFFNALLFLSFQYATFCCILQANLYRHRLAAAPRPRRAAIRYSPWRHRLHSALVPPKRSCQRPMTSLL